MTVAAYQSAYISDFGNTRKDAGIIEEKEGTGKPAYWQLTWEYLPLRWTERQMEVAGG